jgi:hypothetical protein
VVGSADLAGPGKFLEVNNGSVVRGFGERCIYLDLLIRVPWWQSHLYPDTFKCFFGIESSFRLRYRLTTNNDTGENAQMEVKETVTFYSDALAPSASIPQEWAKDPSLDYSLREDRTHEIRDFLRRPVILTDFLWSTTDVSNTVLAQYTNPTTLLSHTMNSEKVRGFVGFKGKMVVRMQVNAQRFQQGRLLLHYIPMYDHQTQPRRDTAMGSLVFKTQQPRIDFDISTDTEVILEIPFVYPFEFYNLKGQYPTVGTFFVSVYSPLISPTGDTNCDVVCWGHFEDVEVVFPTVLSPQVGGGRKSLVTQELEASGPGPISSLFGRVSKAATILGEIPLLSSVAFPAAWFSSVASRAASAMGWSNPSQSAPAGRMQNIRTPYMNNANGVDNSQKLSLMSDNEVEVLPGFAGTNIDELNLRHLVSIPAFIKAVNWTTADATGVLLWGNNVSPLDMANTINAPVTTGTIVTKLPTPLCFFSNFFQFYRGSFCFTVKVVKTEFHSGRLMFTWTPDNGVDPLFTALDPVYKEILDLRHSNEFSVCIPFTSTSPWKYTNESMGRVGIYVLNSLRGPATVSTSVQLLIEANGGPDFELSAPIDANFTPALGVFTPQVGGDMFHPQVLGDDAAECGNAVSMPIADTIASSSNHTGGFAAVRYCTGESIVSMRQLMKRCCPKFSFPIGINAAIQIMPFDIRVPYFIPNANPAISSDTSVDYYDVLGNCFAFSRGGVRWKIWSQGGGIVTYKSRLAISQSGNLYEGVTNTTKALVSSVASSVNVMTGALEVEVPQYGISHMRVNRAGRYSQTTAPSVMNTPLAIEYIGDHVASAPYFHYRQCSDDTDFGFFYGVTLLIPSTGALSSTAPW